MSQITDVVVAWELARRDVDVLLIDRQMPGRATSASAGGLWPVGEAVGLGCGVIYQAARSGTDGNDAVPESLPTVFRDFLVQSNAEFPALSDTLLEQTGVDIELDTGPGLLFLMNSARQQAVVDNIARGLPDGFVLEILTPEEVAGLEPSLTTEIVGGALLPGEHQINPMLLAEAYKRAALAEGARMQHATLVDALKREGDRVVGVEVAGKLIPCGTVVNAAGAWAGGLAATAGMTLPVEPIRGQVVLTETLPSLLTSCITTASCYLSQKRHGEILIGSTTEHVGFDTSVTEEGIGNLCRGAIAAVPRLKDALVKRVWAGLRPGTPDELPVLGPAEGIEGYSNAAGGFRTGIVAAPLMARVVVQDLVGETPDFDISPFLASRFSQASLPA